MKSRPSSGTSFHSLQATSHALQPMQIDVSVKKPTRSVVTGAPRSRTARRRPPRRRGGGNRRAARRAPRPRGRRPGRTSQVCALYSPMWTLGSSASPSRSLAESPFTMPARAPVIGQADLVQPARPDGQRRQALGDHHARLDGCAQGHDRHPAAVLEAALARQLGRDLAEHLGLQLGQVGQPARHPARGVVLGQPVGRGHEGEDLDAGLPVRGVVGVLGAPDLLAGGVGLLGRVERVAERRLVRLVVRGHRPVDRAPPGRRATPCRRPAW